VNKDLVIILPSRNSPQRMDTVINMLYDTCDSKDNFDILGIVDSDQVEMYGDLKTKHPEIIWRHPDHQGYNWKNLNDVHFEFLEETDYYFNWWVVDDFWGLGKDWDKNIISKKGVFDDGYFTMFTTNPMGRNLTALTTQYRKARHWFDGDKKPLVTEPADLIFHYNEQLPICTKKWRLALKPLFEDHGGGASHDTFCAALTHILSVEHGYSRLIEANVFYDNLINNQNAAHITVNGVPRDVFFDNWSRNENFKIIRPIADSVAQSIWQHYTDIMDKPRKIGKFKE
jgi:hypothetical protein